ncbi:hypothetical protein DICPUDRAFT_154965 [Dictyostelium purpureum]|uniref:Uncharacterized protein n=1 Tax=Dictyostelium purpureum TaxID=5786 RepID=F0ZSQ4_DICPU|nr:uncharacterized protein DICPUDRAFT_154965 [Dictyostelium purpureum]EGC33017.1 hypothetical protein DICPUDRAFT_154965 [Dictyostelium purpureum]|eukprot:XP_003290444.1 hypothetical protein DICPUDRAFT_154965 [Dictyostelium purpureum]
MNQELKKLMDGCQGPNVFQQQQFDCDPSQKPQDQKILSGEDVHLFISSEKKESQIDVVQKDKNGDLSLENNKIEDT